MSAMGSSIVDSVITLRERTKTEAFARMVQLLHDPAAQPAELSDAISAAGVMDFQLASYAIAVARERQLAGSLDQHVIASNDATCNLLLFICETEHLVDELRRTRAIREEELRKVADQAGAAFDADLLRDGEQRELKAKYAFLFWPDLFPPPNTPSGRAWYANEAERLKDSPAAETPAIIDSPLYRRAIDIIAAEIARTAGGAK